jgi:hypothetical protein
MPTTPDFSTLEMGPCSVTFKATDLGLTQGGVQVAFATTVQPVKADQYGDSVIDNVISGRTIKVTVPMAERDLTKLAAVSPDRASLARPRRSWSSTLRSAPRFVRSPALSSFTRSSVQPATSRPT